jgi:hypothetical protein
MKKHVLILFLTIALTGMCIGQSHTPPAKQNSKTAPKSKAGSNKKTQLSSGSQESVALSHDSLSRIKAILVVGPVEESTQRYIEKIKEIADFLRNLGVKVTEFYDQDANWTNIVTAAKDAHIFIYSGHGTNMGDQNKAGGFCLSKNAMVSSNSIFNDLKLHKNALVLFQSVCMGAGSSAGDNSDIGLQVALQRVSDYSHPFVRLGAAGYYANNYDQTIVPFLRAFFNKKNITEIYKAEASAYCHIETIQKYKYDSKFEIGIASSDRKGLSTRTTYTNGVKKVEQVPMFKEYEISFVGIPGFTVLDFFR